MVRKVYVPDSTASTSPAKRALKVSTLIDAWGEPPPQLKLTVLSTRVTLGPVRSALLK